MLRGDLTPHSNPGEVLNPLYGCSADNSYGHPEPWALRYYGALGGAIYRTDIQGTVEVVGASDGTFEVTTEQ